MYILAWKATHPVGPGIQHFGSNAYKQQLYKNSSHPILSLHSYFNTILFFFSLFSAVALSPRTNEDIHIRVYS